MAQFTLGPWKLLGDGTIRSRYFGSDMMGDRRGVIVCDLKPAVGGEAWPSIGRAHAMPEAEANGRLIVESPALADALKDMLRILEAVRLSAGLGPKHAERIERARAALSRATASEGEGK